MQRFFRYEIEPLPYAGKGKPMELIVFVTIIIIIFITLIIISEKERRKLSHISPWFYVAIEGMEIEKRIKGLAERESWPHSETLEYTAKRLRDFCRENRISIKEYQNIKEEFIASSL